jgi:MerR family transcriptional regulator, light-induced transcriptional regulator
MSLQEAADALGVHYQTAYGWVRSGDLSARKVGRGYVVSLASVRALGASRAAGLPPPREVRVRDWAVQSQRLYDAIINGQETLARRDLDRLAQGVPIVDLCQLVVGPALRRVGDEWAAGRVTIAAEHRASAICDRLIGARAAHQPSGRPRGTAVVATPPGERHALPSLMAAACLREDRWLVHHLAADLPVNEVGMLAAETGAELVVLSAATAKGNEAAAGAGRQVKAVAPGLAVLTGRPGDSLYELISQARTVAAGDG